MIGKEVYFKQDSENYKIISINGYLKNKELNSLDISNYTKDTIFYLQKNDGKTTTAFNYDLVDINGFYFNNNYIKIIETDYNLEDNIDPQYIEKYNNWFIDKSTVMINQELKKFDNDLSVLIYKTGDIEDGDSSYSALLLDGEGYCIKESMLEDNKDLDEIILKIKDFIEEYKNETSLSLDMN